MWDVGCVNDSQSAKRIAKRHGAWGQVQSSKILLRLIKKFGT